MGDPQRNAHNNPRASRSAGADAGGADATTATCDQDHRDFPCLSHVVMLVRTLSL